MEFDNFTADYLAVDGITHPPRLDNLRKIKRDLTGCQFAKEYYFNQGILETILPLVNLETPDEELLEMLSIVNTYFFFESQPSALECFKLFEGTSFAFLREKIRFPGVPGSIVDMILRVIQSQLDSGLTSARHFEDDFLDVIVKSMSIQSRQRTMIIARITEKLADEELRFRVRPCCAAIIKCLVPVVVSHEAYSEEMLLTSLRTLNVLCQD